MKTMVYGIGIKDVQWASGATSVKLFGNFYVQNINIYSSEYMR